MAEIRIELRGFGTRADTHDNVVGNLEITSSDDFPLSMTMQNFDIRDFNSRAGSFSKTFIIPATKNNNLVLRSVWKSGWTNEYSSLNVLGNIPAVIYADNLPIISGKLKVTKVLKDTDVISYDCSFLGDNMDWANEIKNLDLKELRFSKDAYTSYPPANPVSYVYQDVQGLTGNARDHEQYQFNRDKLHYPLASFGEGLSSRNQVTDADFVPAFYLKNIWDKIFQAQGYSVTSTFCDSDFFKSLIVPFNFENKGEQQNFKFGKIIKDDGYATLDGFFHNAGTGTAANAIGDPTVNNIGTITTGTGAGQKARWVFRGNNLIDDANENPSTETGNVQNGSSGLTSILCKTLNGVHTLSWNITARFFRLSNSNNYGATFTATGEVWKVPDDNSADIYTAIANGGSDGDYELLWTESFGIDEPSHYDVDKTWSGTHNQIADAAGAKFIFVMSLSGGITQGSTNGGSVEFGFKSGTMEIAGSTELNIGDTMSDIQYYLPKGKQSDFVSGVAQMFNLQFETDPINKKIHIEPYDYFYKNERSGLRDWSDKVDYSKKVSEEFMHEIKSNVIFKYKDAGSDGFLERYNKKNMVDWGAYEESNVDGKFMSGEYVVENKFFSPTFNWYEPEYIDQEVGGFHDTERTPCIPIYHTEYSHLPTATSAVRADKNFSIGARVLLTLPVESGALSYASADSATDLHTGYSYNTDGNLEASNDFEFDFCRGNFIHFDNKKGNDVAEADGWSGNSGATSVIKKLSIGSYSTTAFNTVSGEVFIHPNLSFNDVVYNHEQEDWNGTGISSSYTTTTFPHAGQYLMHGLFHNFYGRMIQQLKNSPRIKVVYLNLSYLDIVNLDFRNLIFLDGLYYRINKIIDYKPHLNESTKVELTEFFDLGKEPNTGLPMEILETINL